MSAFCGIFHFEGESVDNEDFARLMAASKPGGVDRSEKWKEDSIAFGHHMIETTPEACFETVPYIEPVSRLAITGSARIDNRNELLVALGIERAQWETTSDSRIIVKAYEAWGATCAERLLGDFAFAIWNPHGREVFCARDHFGIAPFYFSHSSRAFAFCSNIQALLRIPWVSSRKNRNTIARFLAGMQEDDDKTFYADIFRIPPGHFLTVKCAQATLQRYYALPEPETLILKEAEYTERFRIVFETAVVRRMRCNRSISCMLSGGLDSGSVACVAGRNSGGKTIHTITQRYLETPECDEKALFDDVLAQNSFESHFQNVPAKKSLQDLNFLTTVLGFPTAGFGLFTNSMIYPTVAESGVRVVLDGHGGDEVLSDGGATIRLLAEQSRWGELCREWIAIARTYDVPALGPLARMITSQGVIGRIRKRMRFKSRLQKFVRSNQQTENQNSPRWANSLHPDLIVETDLVEQRRHWKTRQSSGAKTPNQAHHHLLANSGQASAFETLGATAAWFGVEPRYPFWDKDVVEFCLSLPHSQKNHRGWSRLILRNSMEEIVPDAVRTRKRKVHFTTQAISAIQSLGKNNIEKIYRGGLAGESGVINDQWFERARDEFFRSKSPHLQLGGDFGLCLSMLDWLRAFSPRNADQNL